MEYTVAEVYNTFSQEQKYMLETIIGKILTPDNILYHEKFINLDFLSNEDQKILARTIINSAIENKRKMRVGGTKI